MKYYVFITRSALAVITAALLASIQATPTDAQEIRTITPSATTSATPTTRQTTPSITSIQTTDISGEVIKVSDSAITIKTSNDTKEIPLSSNIKITRDGNDAQVADIQPGDQAKVTIEGADNAAIVLDATSKQVGNLQQWLLPAIVVGVILLGLIYWLIKKSSTKHIKTTTTNMQ